MAVKRGSEEGRKGEERQETKMIKFSNVYIPIPVTFILPILLLMTSAIF